MQFCDSTPQFVGPLVLLPSRYIEADICNWYNGEKHLKLTICGNQQSHFVKPHALLTLCCGEVSLLLRCTTLLSVHHASVSEVLLQAIV